MVLSPRATMVALRHRDLLGKPLSSYRQRMSPGWPAFFIGLWLLLGILLAINPFEDTFFNVLFMAFFALLLLIIFDMLTNVRLVVCERGIIVGYMSRVLPFVGRFAIGGEEIDPRTVAVVSDGQRASAMLGLEHTVGMPEFPQFFLSGTGPALSFNGPNGAGAGFRRSPTRHRWGRGSIFLFSHRDPARIADEILHAIGRTGQIPQGFTPFNSLQTVHLSGRPEEVSRQIPGGVPLGTTR